MEYEPGFENISDETVRARHKKACKEKKCQVVEPMPDELFVDIDTHAALGYFFINLDRLGPLVLSHTRKMSPSRKDGRYHITVKLSRPVKDVFERIMLQCLLGSDLAREVLSWREATAGVTCPTVFFERLPEVQDLK